MTNFYKNTKLAGKLVNLTAVTTLRTYDNMGNIRDMESKKHKHFAEDIYSILSCKEPYTYFILSKDVATRICKFFPRLDNIAVVKNWDIGRNGVPIAYFVSAKDRKIPIKLYVEPAMATFSHL
ncbi:hypothetical protein IKG60_00880 [Candidatus Saccharibacteria bacterium]|nr:hypothetical protein [Candidatus Saccharibacteria bacterium]